MRNLTEDARLLLTEVRSVIINIEGELLELRERESICNINNYNFIETEEISMLRRKIDSGIKVLDGKGISYGLRNMKEILTPLANGEALSISQYAFLEEAMEKRETELKEYEQNGKLRPHKDCLLIETFWEKHCEEIKSAVVSSRSLGM